MEEEIGLETMGEDIGFETVEESLESQRESERRLMAFSEQDLVLKIENTKLHVSKDQLMKESAVFDRMLTSDFKENDQKEIELDGKNLNNFVDFLRCIMPGVDEDVTDKTVHVILPLADEYQTVTTLKKANQFLAKKSKFLGDKISSAQVMQNILQAELYRLDDYLDESIAIASRKRFEKLVEHPKFKEITQETRLKIMTKRWKDMDGVFKTTDHAQYETECVDFYQELSLTNNITPTTSVGGNFGKGDPVFGQSISTSRSRGARGGFRQRGTSVSDGSRQRGSLFGQSISPSGFGVSDLQKTETLFNQFVWN